MTDDTAPTTSTAALEAMFPDSAEGVALLMTAIRIGGQPVAEGDDDNRLEAIRELFDASTSAVRTRVVVIAEVLRELANTCRLSALNSKRDSGDPDIVEGDAEITADGWLVVSVDGKEISRVPFNPHRPADGMAEKLATDILSEYTRLHSLGGIEAANVTKLPAPGRRTSIAFLPDEKPTSRTVQ